LNTLPAIAPPYAEYRQAIIERHQHRDRREQPQETSRLKDGHGVVHKCTSVRRPAGRARWESMISITPEMRRGHPGGRHPGLILIPAAAKVKYR
jgi:hypothetical protein